MSPRPGSVVVVVGSRKGLFLFHSADRVTWEREGPFFAGTDVYHATLDPRDGRTLLAGASSSHWGPAVSRSTDWGASWSEAAVNPRFPTGSGLSVDRVWQLTPGVADGEWWAGVEPAGLFRSRDGGVSWSSVDAFNLQDDRSEWMPGFGGLCLHSILPDPRHRDRLVIAASAVGIFRSADGGASWEKWAGGVSSVMEPDTRLEDGVIGSCPHKLARDAADPDVVFMQNHRGVYRRAWNDPEWVSVGPRGAGEFGFPVVAHPRDANTFFTVPLEGDFNRVTRDGAFAVHRTRDGGATWEPLTKGLPQSGAFLTVLRDGMAADPLTPAGVYVGTKQGQLWASANDGESWALVAENLPPVLSVEAALAR